MNHVMPPVLVIARYLGWSLIAVAALVAIAAA
jgi:hypothetical protein